MARGCIISTIVLTTLALTLCAIATFIPYWEVEDVSNSVVQGTVRHKGLWIQCNSYGSGGWECDDYNTFFAALPPKQQAARGLTISAIFLSVIAIAIASNAICEDNCNPWSSKVLLLAATGLVSFLAGACMIAAPSIYAKFLYDDYYMRMAEVRFNSNLLSSRPMVFGRALFVAWASGVVFIFTSIIACSTMCCCLEERRDEPYTYRTERIATVSKAVSEYV